MRLLIRLAGGTGAPTDLDVEVAADATVGELADHLAGLVGAEPGLTLGPGDTARVCDRDELVADAGPRSGTTVRLVATGSDEAERPHAPVELAPPGSEPLRLAYGRTVVDGAAFDVGERVHVESTPGVTPTINGQRLLGGARLGHGDLVCTGRRTFEVRLAGPLRPPPPGGPTEPLRRTPASRSDPPTRTVELPTPPAAVRPPGFPVLSAAVPLLMGAALWAVTRSPASVVFVLFSFVFVLASGFESRREARAETRFREEEFRADLEERRALVEHHRSSEQRRLEHDTPPVAEVRAMARRRDPRVWERVIDGTGSALMLVRLGTAELTAADRVVVPTTGRRDLLEELRCCAGELERSHLPVVVDLDRRRGLAIVGPDETATAVARSIVVQVATLFGPDDLAIRVLTSPERGTTWNWCAWLPHTSATDEPHRSFVVVDGGDPSEVVELVRRGGGGVRVLWLSAVPAGLPTGIGAVLHVDEPPGARLSLLGPGGTVESEIGGIELEDLTADEAEPVARSLAPLRPARTVHVGPGPADLHRGAPPPDVRLGEIAVHHDPHSPDTGGAVLGDPGAVEARWRHSAASATLGAPIGRLDRGVFNVDLRADGPHALVAGTTGSGKSELLRTLVASLALHNDPTRLNFLLVDYKGGAAFGPLADLPHTVGLITDLSPPLAQRALRSLRAEVRRREEVLASHGVSDLLELDQRHVAGRPAALAVVVDEFAALARELPEFVDGLVDVAQRGRSLGVHLVLATQRPAGVVTDTIRANTSLRIALRVADEDDSRDVVDDPAAARLPRSVPGRAVVRAGPDHTALVQIAWSGGPERRSERITSRELCIQHRGADTAGSTIPAPGATELELVVRASAAASADSGLASPRRPWVDPLPEEVALRSLLQPCASPGRVHIGLVDRPDRQQRDLLEVDLSRDGGVLVLGASGSGRSTVLRTIATALVANPAETVHVYAIDSGRNLASLASCGAVGDVLAVDDVERGLRLLRATHDEMVRRLERHDGAASVSSEAPHPDRCVVLVDGFAPFEEIQERVNRGESVELLTRLARDGRSVGVHVVVAALRRGEVPPTLAAALGCRLMLRSASEDDALMAGLPAGSASPSTPAGRGHRDQDEVQVAVADEKLLRRVAGTAAPVPALPRRVRTTELPGGSTGGGPATWLLPIGLECDRLDTAWLDLEHHHCVVAGPPRSGVSTALATIASCVDAAFLLGTRDAADQSTWTRTACGSPGSAAGWSEVIEEAVRRAATGRRTVLALDQLPELLERGAADGLDQRLLDLLDLDPAVPLRVVAGGEVDAMSRCYSDVLARLRSGRTGVLLQVDTDLHAGLLHAAPPLRAELPSSTGRGWSVAPGTATPVQVALPPTHPAGGE